MGAVIPAVVALYGAYEAHRAQSDQHRAQLSAAKQQQNILDNTQPAAKQYLDQSKQAIGPAISYYTSLLANPREATAPEQNRISSLYAGQTANVRSQYPRGGYGPAAVERLRSQQLGAQEGVIQQGRPMAASALGSLGTGLGSLGFQGYGMGAGIIGNVFQQGLEARNQQFQQGSALGQGLFGAYQSYLLGRALNSDTESNQTLPVNFGSAMSGSPSTGWSTYQPNFTPGKSSNNSLYSGNTLPNSGPDSGDNW